MSRGRGQTPAPQTTSAGPHLAGEPQPNRGKKRLESSWSKYLFLVLVGGIGILLIALAIWVASSDSNNGQAQYVDSDRYQAVFLNNNQVYFGKITKLNDGYMLLADVFYLQVNQTANVQPGQTANNNNNLVLQKLGKGELHSPDDTMIINASQITFWENIKNDGKVVEAINKYKENPDAAEQSTESTTPSPSSSTTKPNTTTGN